MRKLLILLLYAVCCINTDAQIPQGFNYQAIARDATGTSIANTLLPVRITIQSDSTGGTIFWQELHPGVMSNSYGLITLVVGKGSRISGTVSAFTDINWNITPKFIRTEIDHGGWKNMGSSKLWAVPYSLVAEDLNGSVKKLTVIGETSNMEEALFEVKNKDGQTVFAVYNEGVRIYVSDGDTKGVKGGFAVGGFGTDKAESQKYLVVTKDSTRIYVDSDPATKKAKGGFAVGGYDLTKGTVQNYLDVNPDSIRAYIDHDITKGIKGGFAVGGFGTDKSESQKYLVVSKDSIRMYLDANPLTKGVKGGFAVGGYDLTKGSRDEYMVIKHDSTNFYVKEISPELSSSFNIIGIQQSLVRKSLLFARTDTVGITGVLNLQNNLLIEGNINIAGTIFKDSTKITDVDGNIYNTVKIGTQVWMAENLKTTKFSDAKEIPLVLNSGTWGTLTTPAYCWYNNDEAGTKTTYGALYNWYTISTGNLCPSGWHIPDNSEWTILTDYLGGAEIAGGKLKEAGLAHWSSPNTGATDEVYFTGLPGGARGGTGDFANIGNYGYWWTADGHSVDPEYAWGFVLSYNTAAVIRADYYYKRDGFSVRCVKDN